MKIKIVSDLHTENLTDFKFIGKGDFDSLFIAGDISTRADVEEHFLIQFKKPIYVVSGNHLGYNFPPYFRLFSNEPSNIKFLKSYTHEGQVKELVKCFNTFNPNIHYLQNTYTKLGNYTVFGGVMYTNFDLFNGWLEGSSKEDCMEEAKYMINDFKMSYRYSKSRGFVRLTPKDYVRYFNIFMKKLKKCLKETDTDIIVLSHFCPSLKSIDLSKYVWSDDINAYFASNLDNFIQDNPRIKLWVHGHTHSACDYMIGNCRVVCNPFGYLGENYRNYTDYKEVIVEV